MATYSITLSARAWSVGGTVTPSGLAVLRFSPFALSLLLHLHPARDSDLVGEKASSSAPDPFCMSPYEPLRSTMQAPPARRMSAQRLLALSKVSVPTRIW